MNTIHIGQPWTTHLALHISLTHNIRLIHSHQEKRNSCPYGFHMRRCCNYAVLFLWLAIILACARLPEYARPRMVQAHEQRETLVTGFPYRLLTPGDFRATSLPEQLAEHADRINAHATIRIRLTADSSFRITSGDFRSRIKIGPQFLPHLVNKTSLEAPVAIYRLSPFSAKTSSLRVSSGGSFCRNICIPL